MEFLRHCGQDEGGLRFCEFAADANPLSASEREIGELRQSFLKLRGPAFGAELERSIIEAAVTMNHPGSHDKICALRKFIAANLDGFHVLAYERRNGRIEPHAFLDHILQIGQTRQVLDAWSAGSQHVVQFAHQFGLNLRMLRQKIPGIRKRQSRGIVSRRDHRHRFVANPAVTDRIAVFVTGME